MNLRKRRINELKRLSYKLKEKYNQTQSFRRLYEKANKKEDIKDSIEKCILIANGENRNIFSEVPEDIIEYLIKVGKIDDRLFDYKTKTISISTYKDLLELLGYLIKILEFDLTQSYLQSEITQIEL